MASSTSTNTAHRPSHHRQEHSDHVDTSSHESYNSSSSNTSSKQVSPAPSNRSDSNSNPDYPAMKGSKGKLFQCSGFGDCRMVFTRSEHLARHARKHTGEKPFQCVVDGCTRMFSRFDNMVQHTQTHTKGARRESSAGIASKIAIESRRKSEAGSPSGGHTGKATKTKRGPSSSSETKGRKNRVQSMPLLNFGSTKDNSSSLTSVPLSPITGSSKSSSPGLSVPKEDTGRDKKKNQASAGVSWYASKLHHSFDQSLSYGRVNLDHLPPLGRDYMDDCNSYNRSRHPLSPERSSHSEEDDDYEDSHYQSNYRQWGGMVDSMDVTLPPLRSSNDSTSTRLPSISRGYSHNMNYMGPEQPIVRRLSLAELEMPIDESIKSLSQEPEQRVVVLPKHDGVGVSEDELHALEAFGQLWSQGRDYVSGPDDPTLVKIKMEDLSAPGLDHGRRSPRGDAKGFRDDSKMTMDLD
ncbi:hypothetical protein BG006_005465 [Podila minutissima]|uniref:C2H2-type domain-containing protein n=1 Tax=Podila minutissima TaxID=64525 RepID=A0A9P5SMK3_9FUNG|nr:hypothetical protein BG006_005465 [Podila minutissima]